MRVEQRIALAHLFDQPETRIVGVARNDSVDDLGRLPARLEMRPQRQSETGVQQRTVDSSRPNAFSMLCSPQDGASST